MANPFGMSFAELYCDLFRLTGNREFLDRADDLLRPWLENPFYRRYRLFPQTHFAYPEVANRIYYRLSPKRHVRVMKDNTNPAYALIELFKLTGREDLRRHLLDWAQSVRTKMMDDRGAVHTYWDFRYGRREISLLFNFPVMEVLCDLYVFVAGDPVHLETAKRIADFWLRQQWPSGLFPRAADGRADHIDDQTDFVIALTKLAEITGEPHYREAAERCLDAVFRLHRSPKGYVLSVDSAGRPVDPTISPKYNGLLLKLVILKREDVPLYRNAKQFDLLKDR